MGKKMISSLETKDIHCLDDSKIIFDKNINIVEGNISPSNNVILDILWWSLVQKWPHEIHGRLEQGYMPRPTPAKKGKIILSLEDNISYISTFDYKKQLWKTKKDKEDTKKFIFYAMSNGNFALYDPCRNDRKTGIPPYVFTPYDVLNGLVKNTVHYCNGLIHDWANWQKGREKTYDLLKNMLAMFSWRNQTFLPGKLTRIAINDVRDMPTVIPSHQDREIPFVFLHPSLQRIFEIVYLLLWNWHEHQKACRASGEELTDSIIFMIDMMEQQKSIIDYIFNIISLIIKGNIQIIAIDSK